MMMATTQTQMYDWRSRRGPNQDTGSDGAGKKVKEKGFTLINIVHTPDIRA